MAKPKKSDTGDSKNTVPKPPSRAKCYSIIERYLKVGQKILPGRDLAAFYRLWKQYPSEVFWLTYELPFGLNSLNFFTWFEGVEGKAELDRAWLMFNYIPKDQEVETPKSEPFSEVIDNSTEPNYDTNIPKPICAPSKPKTVAEWFKNKS